LVLKRFALKGQQIRRGGLGSEPKMWRPENRDSGATFRAHLLRLTNPGLRPWAMIYNRFSVRNYDCR
jgi:hypothetical protein